jgi:anti-sigma-K factor RskA
MGHVDPDILALLALGEQVSDRETREHLAGCADCSTELAQFDRAVDAGRSTINLGELAEPASRVWTRIADELGLEKEAEPAPVVHLEFRRRRWGALVAVAASIALVASGGAALWQLGQPTPPTILATATLDAFPDWPDASGEAIVELGRDGNRVVRVTLDAPNVGDEFTEVWLISSDATRLISLGTVSGTSGTFSIPSGVDLSVYDLVDVSAEPYDGKPTHSGDSIVRGQLS